MPVSDDDIYGASPPPPPRRRVSSSPAGSSDKENNRRMSAKLPTPASAEDRKRRRQTESVQAGKRQRISVEDDQDEREQENPPEELKLGYNPDQPIEEKRALRRGFRDLNQEISEKGNDYSLYDTLTKQNEIFGNVQQTAEATIDSRMLIFAAEKGYRSIDKVKSANGVDLEEFVSKLITFMSNGRAGGDEDGDPLDWERLGRRACLPYISRPAVPGFLLGPLSLEKKARKVAQRTARLKVSDYTQTQPQTLKMGESDQGENKSLLHMSRMIHKKLIQSRRERVSAVKAVRRQNPNLPKDEMKQLMESHGLLFPDAGINYWEFVINPQSFAQTVENIFYVSFLLRDGLARITPDEDGQLGLFPEESGGDEDQRHKESTKYNAIISIDMAEWKTLIELYGIKESIIEHRNDEVVGGSGWAP